MALIHRKDEDEERSIIDGVEVIGRGDVPDDLPEAECDIHEGRTAEDISGTTARREAEGALETEPDPELAGDAIDESAPSEDEDDPSEDEDPGGWDGGEPDAGSGSGRLVTFLIILVVAVIIAAIVGYFIGSGGFGSSGSSDDGSSTTGLSAAYISEDELDNVVATWTYDGEEHTLTAQEAIESEYSLETVEQDDGTYPAPTADTILSYVRNLILFDAAEDAGIEVTEDEVLEYAEDTIGLSDYEEIAESYGVSEEQAEDIMTMMTTIQELYLSVIPETDVELPDAPTEPEDDEEDTATEEYAAYIIELAGDEWDEDEGEWASEDGEYYAALGDDFDGETATYEQACTAYYVAYELYYEAATEVSSVWTDYVNGLYGEADIMIYGLYA